MLKQIRPHAHTLFWTQTGRGFSWPVCLYIYIYICTEDRLFEDVNHRTVKNSNIVSLSFSLPWAFDVVIGAGLAFFTQVESAASGLHACVFFHRRKKHSLCLRPSFYMVLTQSLDPDAHNPTVITCLPITFALLWFLMIIDHCMRDRIHIYIDLHEYIYTFPRN